MAKVHVVKSRHRRKRRWLSRLIASLIPRYGRRAIFLTSLFIYVSRLSPRHEALLEELNAKFKIMTNGQCLLLPALSYQRVWKGIDVDTLSLNQQLIDDASIDERLDEIARQFIEEVPEWSYYSEKAVVLTETKKMLQHSLLVSKQA